MMLEARGDMMVYVNGEPHAGDPYSNGKLHIPVLLKKGANELVFSHAGRGGMKAALSAPKSEVFVCEDDITAPNVLSDQPQEYWIGAPIVNATTATRRLAISVMPKDAKGGAIEETIELPALTVQKAAIRTKLATAKGNGDVEASIVIRDAGSGAAGAPIASTPIKLQSKSPDEVHRRTFVSGIDGSVQYVAITPPAVEGRIEHPGLVVSLHGADVEADRQAPCYTQKPDFVVVCPTNRRPYGFDWEDWGRVDAVEVMDHAKEWFHTDPRKQYLTGHSMGGHGTWQLGVLLTDRFAVVAPSAGWLSFDSYAGVRGEATETTETQLRAMFRRAAASSDTFSLMPNLKSAGVYILHGDADDNVPVAEARKAKEELTKLGVAFEYHEQPGVGHWWDTDGPGIACVDWPAIFEMFRSHALPKPGEKSEFHLRSLETGVALGPSDGVAIGRAEHPGRLATADVTVDRGAGNITIACDNAASITLGEQVIPDAPGCTIQIDGRTIKAARHGSHVTIVKLNDGRWADAGEDPSGSAATSSASAAPSGPFKNAFTNHFVLVYGTHGDAEENTWSLARARFDAEQWWYRGNGRAVLVSDDSFLSGLDAGKVAGNAILYGGSPLNAAAARLCAGQATRIEKGSVTVGDHHLTGDDLGVLTIGTFSAGSEHGRFTYGLLGGSGKAGMRVTERLPYLSSGVGVPDLCIVHGDLWAKGSQSIEAAGFLDREFSTKHAEIVWKTPEAAPNADRIK
jgi:dienelactone hydrolase